MITQQDCVVCVSCDNHVVRKTGIKPCDNRMECCKYLEHHKRQAEIRKEEKEARELEVASLDYVYRLKKTRRR